MSRLALTLKNGATALTLDHPGEPERLLDDFKSTEGPFAGRQWVDVEPGLRCVRYDEVVEVQVAPGA
jgi:hypothetical protein